MERTLAVVQPNYIPWKGYFDLIDRADEFILYDDVQYTKNDWRNRNRIKTADGLRWLTISVDYRFSRHQTIRETRIDDTGWVDRHLHTLRDHYATTRRHERVHKRPEPRHNGHRPKQLCAWIGKAANPPCVAVREDFGKGPLRLENRHTHVSAGEHSCTEQDNVLVVGDRGVQQKDAAADDGQGGQQSKIADRKQPPFARGEREQTSPHRAEGGVPMCHRDQNDTRSRKHPVGKPETELVTRQKEKVPSGGGLKRLDPSEQGVDSHQQYSDPQVSDADTRDAWHALIHTSAPTNSLCSRPIYNASTNLPSR